MAEFGALIGRFHNLATEHVTDEVGVGHNISVLDLLEPSTWSAARFNEDGSAVLRRALDDLEAGLDRIDHRAAPVSVIHGDLTRHNVVASGHPPSPTGLIDFSNCYREATLADIGFGLWRSGRPSQNAHRFDPARIAECLIGYRSARPALPDMADAVIVYLLARGLQIAAKQSRLTHDLAPPLTSRLAWLHAHANELRDDVQTRLQAAK
jgi:Ser/Thr protein kinase RdoA (MazF antagonist)